MVHDKNTISGRVLLNFLCIGVMRSGTSWLYKILRSNPDVYLCSYKKEIDFFTKHYEKGINWYTDFIPKSWLIELFLKLYSFRPMIEQGNASNNTYYNASRMNTRGLDAAIKQRVSIYILELLKALTAYKLGFPDLIMMPTAFGASKYFGVQFTKPLFVEKSGYLIFKNVI